jgi:hypothetical protein
VRKKRDVIAGRALVIDRSYVHSVLASEVGAELSGAVACLLGCRFRVLWLI